jgi:hypothetical protein
MSDHSTSQHAASRQSRGRRGASSRPASPAFHILFGSLERLLADLASVGAPDRGTVRVARQSRRHQGELAELRCMASR